MSTRWNYLTVKVKPGLMGGFDPEAIQSELVKHGNQGWELVNMIAPTHGVSALLIFKRPV
ncbi:hypothetical protein CSC70_11165 [Pseudoxanthomonas kalamensis DSM 18571]|uniref:DUF4177 domain-containing protein n=1 Tax=Pseudoxanthomonas kalamensis TaxID=289483 RepID=UPI00139125E2|nr:DUF4177 domain-containing protein [Pseudoxanthomonas kalamensis]KAF1709360.1 hypothetical protein CSC70_11165 [Pseudoxanthomonas kalamensis DSM 18571]